MSDKPPFRVPSMDEIAKIPANGYNAISTFSGCGGSSLGYRMAGFRVLWASEFVEAARDTYLANAPSYTILDGRDIREVDPAEVLTAIGLAVGDLDLMDGSPPCASFSTAGKRQKHWGSVKKYSDTQQRTDDLFFEFTRLLRGIQPRVFVAENVAGLVKGAAKGYFIEILRELRSCGYRVQAKLLDAQWLGVPQARQRLIFIGVREDIDLQPAFPVPLPYRYSMREILPGASAVIHDTSGNRSLGDVTDRPSPTITVGGLQVNACHYQVRGTDPGPLADPETGKDLSIERFAIGREWKRLRQGEGSDRYLNLTRPSVDAASPTVTALGGNIGAASVTHPVQARKFTLGELRAICGFPADFVLTGTYEQRWERLGRAVPPLMMRAIAETIRDQVLDPANEQRKAS